MYPGNTEWVFSTQTKISIIILSGMGHTHKYKIEREKKTQLIYLSIYLSIYIYKLGKNRKNNTYGVNAKLA